MNQDTADSIKQQFESLTKISVSATYLEQGRHHSPTSLPPGMQGVYAFLAGKTCFKVGKAGAKSKARWNSHHYNLDEKTPSTLPKSIMRDIGKFKSFFPNEKHAEIDALSKATMQVWIKQNLSRMEFLIRDDGGPFALNLLEALAQYRLKPEYEGKNS